MRLKIPVYEEQLNDRARKNSTTQSDRQIRKILRQLKETRQFKTFDLYEEELLYPDPLTKKRVIDKVVIKRDQDEDVDTDEEVLKRNKKDCMLDLKKAIDEFTQGNPY